MSVPVGLPNAEEPRVAHVATPGRIFQGFLSDFLGWVMPWVVVVVVVSIPLLHIPAGWSVCLLCVAAIFTLMNIHLDIQSFREFGATPGMTKHKLFAVDLALDHNIANVRRFRKKIRKLLAGDYEIFDNS